MVKSGGLCESSVPETKAEKLWPYEQYYLGERYREKRKHGYGENYWTGAESLESYHGNFVRDAMHEYGEYRWRFLGAEGLFVTYEGYFYMNAMHGYGTMSYPDGRIFNGLFLSNTRWGPGVETHTCLREDVGLWRGTQLIRLCWRPSSPSIAPDFSGISNGSVCVEPSRVILTTSVKKIGEVNSALELLKKLGVDPKIATVKWNRLYPKHCTDQVSALCHVDVFDHTYHKGKIFSLQELENITADKERSYAEFVSKCQNKLIGKAVSICQEAADLENSNDFDDVGTYYAWNNNKIMILIMKHCYSHEMQRNNTGLNLKTILSGPRQSFKTAGQHELDCRTLLMASYLGHIINVVQLVNENNVHPDVADIQGNNTIMYAACGDHTDIIHFLVEAGANVDSYNDSCCTPLGVAIMRFVCAKKDISPNGMITALLPPLSVPAPSEQNAIEWDITRETPIDTRPPALTKQLSKTTKLMSSSMKGIKSLKSLLTIKDTVTSKRKMETILETTPESDGSQFSEGKRLYITINQEYSIRIKDLYELPSAINPVLYLFDIHDMMQDIEASNEDQKKLPDKNPNPKKVVSKVLKGAIKASKEVVWQNNEKDELVSIDSAEKEKLHRLKIILENIYQLLSDGAKPKLVRVPQPALVMAIVSESSELVQHLIHHGADVNEVYEQMLNYTPLDLAVSRSLTFDNLEVIRALLEGGSNANHRLYHEQTDSTMPAIPGPTLLHTVLARKTENETEEEIRRQLLESLLQYNCNPIIQFKGQSAIDIVLEKNIELLDVFIESPKTNLNEIINESNQSILVKMFSLPFFKTVISTERLQILTNLLLFGADPYIECHNEDESYQNIFVFARKVLTDMENPKSVPVTSAIKPDPKSKKENKQKDEKLAVKSAGKISMDDLDNYKQAIDLVNECARLIHIRWLQANIFKELFEMITKFKYRHWNMILRERKRKKVVSLWLTAPRCLEIWDILKTTKKKVYSDYKVVKYLLFIVQYCNYSSGKAKTMTAQDKDLIEKIVHQLLREQKNISMSSEDIRWKRPYVKPELIDKADKKFDVCFECALPLIDQELKIICSLCKLVSFCSKECLIFNVNRPNCHPCRAYLKKKYSLIFSSATDAEPL